MYDSTSFIIEKKRIKPKHDAKILGVIINLKLNYKKHISKKATKSLQAAITLKHL